MANSYRLKPKIKQKLKKEIKEFPELEPMSDKVANIKLVSDALLDYMNQKGSGQK